jgi:hypothetical protein
MAFLNPTMLVGLAAALVPIVLHLLNRARYRSVDWGAMMFLEEVAGRPFQSARLKQWGLLAVRSLIVALLAVSLARPVLLGGGPPPARPGRTAAVLLLDRSASMSLIDNGRPRLDLAREAIFQLLSPGFHRGDDLWLITLGDGGPDAAAPRYASDPQEMARRVKEVPSPSGEADIAAGLRQALDVLSNAEAVNREIYLVCDRQAGGWAHVDQQFAAQWRRRIERGFTQPPRLIVVPVGTDEMDNVAVEAVEPLRRPLVTEHPVDLEVRVRNYGPVPRAAVPLAIEVLPPTRRTILKTLSINLPASGVATVTVPITPADAGSSVITTRVSAPGLSTDKQFQLSVDVLRSLNVLVVDGEEREGALQSGSDYLKLALAPYKSAADKRNTASVTVVRPDAWSPSDLRDCRVLVLANVPALTEAQAAAIEQFVYGGGGLIVAPGDQTRVENYNVQLPWLPAVLQPATPESQSASATTLGDLDLTHPLFRFLKGRTDSDPAAVRRYFPAIARPGATLLGSFSDGKPFLLERDAGRGRVLLMTTPIDTDWSALPLTHLFLPLAQSMVRYTASGPSARHEATRNLSPGQPIIADFDEPLNPATISVTLPDARQDTAWTISQFATSSELTFGKTWWPGIYRISPRGPSDAKTVQVVVRTPASESNLTPLSHEQWKRLEALVPMDRLDPQHQPLAAEQEAARAGTELWLPLLGGAMVLSILELSATRRWAGRDP